METKEEYRPIEQDIDHGIHRPPTPPATEHSDEIDLFEIIQQIWERRNIIIAATLFFLVFGVFIAVVSPVEYTSDVVLMPQTDSPGSNASNLLRQFGGLAGIGGLGNSSSGSIGINLYPDITQSTPFFLYMMDQQVFVSNMDTTVTLLTYFSDLNERPVTDYIKQYTIGLPKMLIGLPLKVVNSFFKSQDQVPDTTETQTKGTNTEEVAFNPSLLNDSIQSVIKLNGKELSAIGKLRQRIETTIEDNGMLRVSATMPDPYAAAKVTALSVNFLTNYLTEYKTEKSKSNLEFLEEQYEQAKQKYFQTQQQVAQFQDRNSNIVSATVQTNLERLQNENDLAFRVYQGLAQQLEQARITVQEETPVFKVLEPIQIPLGSSAPNRELIIFTFVFLGIFIGFSIVMLNIIYKYLKPKLLASKGRE